MRTVHTESAGSPSDSTKTLSTRIGIPSAINGVAPSNKRKADGELVRPNDKVVKRDTTASKPINGISTSNKPPVQISPRRPSVVNTSSTPSVPYRGTGKPISTTQIPVSPAISETKIPPKKGSFAEIMARAKAVQSTTAPVGIIKHKPKEKQLSSKKELLLQKKGIKPAGQDAGLKSTPGSKSSSPGPKPNRSDRKEPRGPAQGNKAAQAGYKGTAKPVAQPGYKGTMKPLVSNSASGKKKASAPDDDRDRNRSRSNSVSAPKYRYKESYSDEDDDEDEGVDQESDLSDMEAGFSDVEEEDERALKTAKKEDEFEAKMEAELKRQKEERRRRLAEMAKKAQRR